MLEFLTLYNWMQEADLNKQPAVSRDIVALKKEIARLNASLKRITEDGDILKRPQGVQLVVATHASSLSAGVQKFMVFRGADLTVKQLYLN